MNLDLRFRPGLGGHQVPKTACNTVCCGINLDFMFRLFLNQCLEGIRLPNSLQDLLLRLLSTDLLKLFPGTSGFGGDSDAVQGQVNEQLTPASRDSFAALSSDRFVLSFAALRSDGFFFGVVKVFCFVALSFLPFGVKGSLTAAPKICRRTNPCL